MLSRFIASHTDIFASVANVEASIKQSVTDLSLLFLFQALVKASSDIANLVNRLDAMIVSSDGRLREEVENEVNDLSDFIYFFRSDLCAGAPELRHALTMCLVGVWWCG